MKEDVIKLLPMRYPDLPVSKVRDEVLAALKDHQVVVVVGATGSGKTTQLPKMALEYLHQVNPDGKGIVGCTQPRRIAAASVAKRVAEEMQVKLGGAVGYQVRFEDICSDKTVVKFMTDGILLAETQGDEQLENYGVIIIDEAHERSLNIDFLLGYLRRLLAQRKDLRVIISSATLDAGGFADFFSSEGNEVPMIDVEGRTFPVETHYLPAEEDEYTAQHVARAVQKIARDGGLGDVLVFLPGEREIRDCADVLEGRNMQNTMILPLFARMGMSDQQRVFSTIPGTRRVVLATNVAETSLTIPGIVYVVDAGTARVSRWNPSRQVQRLQVEKISQASARQRLGRCGRISDGVCVRLYDEQDFNERPEFTDPEIRRSSLAGVILRMKALGLPEIEEFPFLDPPSSKHIAEGYRTLREIHALDDEHEITAIGRKIARVAVEPRLARILLESLHVGCYEEMLVIVSGLSIMDPRERPAERQKEADDAHKKWADDESDFISILHLWHDLSQFRDKKRWQRNPLRKFCKRNYLNFRRVMEWGNLHSELRGQGLGRAPKGIAQGSLADMTSWASNEVIHKALLVGMPRQVGKYDKKSRSYQGVNAREFAIFPGSGVFGKLKHEWILAYDMVDTTRLWARKVAKISPFWLEDVVPELCRYRYHSAKWDRKQGAVYAQEVVVFGPLKIVEGRNVHFGRIDPAAARDIFIREGLLANGLHAQPACLKMLAQLKSQVADVEQKLRRVGGIWSDECVIEFFESRIPKEIFTAKAFMRWEGENRQKIALRMSDVMYEDVTDLGLENFPDSVTDAEQEYSIYYRVAPGEPDDGVTFGVHIDQLPEMDEFLPEWGIRGDLEYRLSLLIKKLPKKLRISCNPVSVAIDDFIKQMEFGVGSLFAQLGESLTRRSGQLIGAGFFSEENLPEELRSKIWVCDDAGNELAIGYNVVQLRAQLRGLTDARLEQESGAEWELSGMREWDCGELPERVDVRGKSTYLGLIDEGTGVGVKVYLDSLQAWKSHLAGCVRLFLMRHHDHAKYVSKHLPLTLETKLYLPTLGEKPVSHTEILRCGVEAIFLPQPPRDAASFEAAADRGRGEIFSNIEALGGVLEKMINFSREVESFIEANIGDRHLGEVAEDLRDQMNWLLRADFISQAGWQQLHRYPHYFAGMLERIKRLKSLPLIKDLEKMDDFHDVGDTWRDLWKAGKQSAHHIATGYLLEELRLLFFAPILVTKGAVSAKKVKQSIEALA